MDATCVLWTLGCLHVLAAMSNDDINIHMQTYIMTCVLVSLSSSLEMELLGHAVVLYLTS